MGNIEVTEETPQVRLWKVSPSSFPLGPNLQKPSQFVLPQIPTMMGLYKTTNTTNHRLKLSEKYFSGVYNSNK